MKIPFEWSEDLTPEHPTISTVRAKVIGGWLVICQNVAIDEMTSAFVPDPHYDWEIADERANYTNTD